jgi:hypothetical protein
VAFINDLNAQWVTASHRLSPRVLTDLYERASGDAADWWESQALSTPALFAVSWAGEDASENWMDIGREFTELWHHQQQIRMAVDAESLSDPRYLRAVLGLGVRALPHAYRQVEAEPGTSVVLEVNGDAGSRWTLTRAADRWTLAEGEDGIAAARVRIDDETAWRMLFNAFTEGMAAGRAIVTGRTELASPLFRARSVIV